MHLFRVLLCICRLVAIHLANMAALETVLAEKVIFAVVTLNIGQLDLTLTAVDDQESFRFCQES